MADLSNNIQAALKKAMSAGNYNAAPSTLEHGAAVQKENLSPVMETVTFEEDSFFLTKMVDSEPCKSTLAQFNRTLGYGILGGSATTEGGVGSEEDSQMTRVVVPMCYYSHQRRATMVSDIVETVDGKKGSDRNAEHAALKLGGDIEYDIGRGKSDYSNSGVFDGNPAVIGEMPNMLGLEVQIRMSDSERNAKDAMFGEFGNDDSVVIEVGGTLTQPSIEDAALRSANNWGKATTLLVAPNVASAYNKISLGKERIILAGSPQNATGAELRRQWTSSGEVTVEGSQWLRAKVKPAPLRSHTNAALPSQGVSGSATSGTTSLAAGDYIYFVTAFNEISESAAAVSSAVTASATDQVTLTIQPPSSGTVRGFCVYRSEADGAVSTAKYIGRVKAASSGNTTFVDLNNKLPGSMNGLLVQKDTFGMLEMQPYSRVTLAQTDLSKIEAFFTFKTLGVKQPRKNVVMSSLTS